MKRNLLLITIAILCSCNKSSNQIEPIKLTNISNGIKEHSSKDGVWDVLGYGYNITGEYGNASSSTFQVVNVAALKAAYPDRVEQDNSTSQVGSVTTGSNALEYGKKLSVQVTANPLWAVFNGTIKKSFSDTSTFSSKYLYSSYDLKIIQRRLKFNATIDILKQYLTNSFISDIQTQSPQYIISHYGTHILADISLGGKLQIMYQSETSNSKRQTASAAGLDIKVKAIFGLNTGINSNSSESSENFSQNIHFETHGGDPTLSLIGNVPVDNSAPTINITNWQSSCSPANSEMIDINAQGLIPIYELVANEAKKQALKTYFSQYLEANQIKLKPQPVYGYYAPNGQDHYLTLSSKLLAGNPTWNYLGIAFQAYNVQLPGTVPVYGFYNHVTDHAYSTNPNYAVTNGWTNEGISFYVYPTQQPGTAPVYEWYKGIWTDHVYTIDNSSMAGYTGWVNQGIMFYAIRN